MTIHHHPSDALLMAYGSGALREGAALVVATHAALCPACRARAASVEAIGGALLEQLAPVALADDALARTLARLTTPAPVAPPRPAPEGPPLPAPLRDYLGPGDWTRRWTADAPGIRHIEILPDRLGRGAVRLLSVAAGTEFPHHQHHDCELVVVLAGAYGDECDHYGQGDLAEMESGTAHRPRVDASCDCLCLIATA